MSTKWIVGAAALAAAALLWVGRLGRTHELREPESSAASAAGLAAPARPASEPMADPSRAEVATERLALSTSASLTTSIATELLVHVTWARDGSPAADVPLRVESVDAEPYRLETTGTTDASGTARFAALSPGQQVVDTLRDARDSVQLDGLPTADGEPRTVELAIPLGLDVDCRVVDGEGAGVAGAEVWLSDGSSWSGIVVGRTDADGRLALRDVPGQHRSLAARAPGHAPSTQREYRGRPGARLEVELVLPGPGASLAGVVQDPSGTPLAGVEVLVGEEIPGGAEGTPRQATSGADGSFLVNGLAPGPLSIFARAPGYGTAHAEVELAPNETEHCTLVLPPEARVTGVARDGGGRPLSGVHITGGARWWVQDVGSVGPFSGRETRTGADGSYVLGGLEAGHWVIEAKGGANGDTRSTLQLHSGEETRWDVVLTAGGVLAGVVLDERGAPLSHWHVAAVDPGDPLRWLRSAYSDAAGRFRMEDCPAQRFVLALRAPEEERGDPVLVLEDFRVGDETLVLRAMDACRPSAFIVGRLVAADGGPPDEVELSLVPVSTGMGSIDVPDADGRFRIGPLRSGEYSLQAGYQARTPRFTLLAGETKDLGDWVLERCGWIQLRAVAKGGGALPAGAVPDEVPLLRDGENWRWISFEDPWQGRSLPLSPGTYLVRSREGLWCAPDAEVEVRPGETAEIELAFEPATERRIEVVAADGAHPRLEVSVLDANGRVLDQRRFREDDTFASAQRVAGDDRYTAWLGGLVPGSYRIQVSARDGRSATGELRVLDLTDDDTPLVLTLR